MASLYFNSDYASAGLHPNGVQQGINLEYTIDGIRDANSPFGKETMINPNVPGFTAVYSLQTIGNPIDTFAATGLEDKPAAIVSLEGTPVPSNARVPSDPAADEEAALNWLDENLCFQGITEPMTEPIKLDTTHTFRVVVNGASDLTVNEDCVAGDTLVWRAVDAKRVEQKKRGTMLERINPNSPDIVPLRDEYFAGTLRDITAKVVRLLEPSDFRIAPDGSKKIARLSSLTDRLAKALQGEMDGLARGKKRQIVRILGLIENALAFAHKVGEYAKVTNPSNGEKRDHTDGIAADAGALASNIGSHYSDIASHKVGRAHKNAKAGFTTFCQVNTGSS